jgi:hypothetical protein
MWGIAPHMTRIRILYLYLCDNVKMFDQKRKERSQQDVETDRAQKYMRNKVHIWNSAEVNLLRDGGGEALKRRWVAAFL